MLKVLIIADDLTGAADCAAACGPNALVVLDDSRGVAGAEVVAFKELARTTEPGSAGPSRVSDGLESQAGPVRAFDANTRSMDAAGAAAETARIVRAYPASIVYKKIDSTLRGHVAAEIAAALEAYRGLGHPNAIAVVAPAFPAMGRTTKGGRQYVRGAPVENGDLKGLPDAAICDAETDEDLRTIAAEWMGREVVWVGSAGLMSALMWGVEKRESPRAPKAEGPIIFAVGSFSERSREQVEALKESGIGSDLILVGEPEGLAREVVRRESIGGLVLTGGDTARAILRALGVAALRVVGEVEAGVPMLVTEGARRLPVVTKAGDFGDRGTLVRCRATIRAGKRENQCN